MAVRSALEDFEGTTLSAISGLLAKLHYLATLHDGNGHYSHWGMERVHGTDASARAIRASHVAIVTQVLRAPMRVLLEDVGLSASRLGVPDSEFVRFLKNSQHRVLPERCMAASQKHLMAVLHALSSLLERQERASRLGASRLRPLAQ